MSRCACKPCLYTRRLALLLMLPIIVAIYLLFCLVCAIGLCYFDLSDRFAKDWASPVNPKLGI